MGCRVTHLARRAIQVGYVMLTYTHLMTNGFPCPGLCNVAWMDNFTYEEMVIHRSGNPHRAAKKAEIVDGLGTDPNIRSPKSLWILFALWIKHLREFSTLICPKSGTQKSAFLPFKWEKLIRFFAK